MSTTFKVVTVLSVSLICIALLGMFWEAIWGSGFEWSAHLLVCISVLFFALLNFALYYREEKGRGDRKKQDEQKEKTDRLAAVLNKGMVPETAVKRLQENFGGNRPARYYSSEVKKWIEVDTLEGTFVISYAEDSVRGWKTK